VQDQFPVMRVGGEYFTMSLRMMKAVWCACPSLYFLLVPADRAQAERAAAQGVREPREGAVRGLEAADP
jgi:hypothetical protein